KAAHQMALVNAPDAFEQTLGALPEGVAVTVDLCGNDPLDVIVFFAKRQSELHKKFAALARRLAPAGGLWIAWPKRASGVATDLTEDTIRAIGLKNRLVDNKVCAIDDTWSGLRFVIRLKDRRD